MKFTEKSVAATTCPEGRKDLLVFDDDVKGFGLRVTASGGRTFLAQYRSAGGDKRRVVLGTHGVLTVDQARKRAMAVLGKASEGRDPFAEKRAAVAAAKIKAEADAVTVDSIICAWAERHLKDRSPSYRKAAPTRLRAALGSHLTLPAAALTRAMAGKALDDVAAGPGPIAANRARAYGRACFTWACKRGLIESSPFANLPTPSQERSRDRIMSDDELARVWRASGRLQPQWAALVRAMILTGQRRSEIAEMEWSELSEDRRTFTLPGSRSKNGVVHSVPMSPPMVELLAARPRIADVSFVFSEGRKNAPDGFGKLKLALDAEAREPDGFGNPTLPALAPWVLHDLRRTVATGLQRLGVRLEVTEAVLNHTSGSRTGIVGVYQRHTWSDEKRAALEAWAAHVLAIGEGVEHDSNVVLMARAG